MNALIPEQTQNHKMFGGIGRALSHKYYAIYWTSNAINTTGRWMYRIAVGWLAWELTESTIWLGIIAFAETFPLVIFSVIAGALADRMGYIKITIIAQTATAFVSVIFAVMTLFGFTSIESVLVFALLIGTLEALTTPARMALIHGLVPQEDLAAAIGLQSASFNGARFIGPAIAGIMISTVGTGAVLSLVALTFIQFCPILLYIKVIEPERKKGAFINIWNDIRIGISYSVRHTGIRFLLVLLGITGLLIRPIIELMPAFAEEVFKSGSGGFGFLMSALGLGAMISCLWIGLRGRTVGLTQLVTLSLLAQGVALILSTLTESIWVAAFCLGIVGFAMLVGGVGSQTLIQNTVKADVRARVMSLFILISWGLPAFGAILAGWVADFSGLTITIAAGGALTIGLWLCAQPMVSKVQDNLEQSSKS